MAVLEEGNPLDYRQGGDTLDDFAQKYIAEMARIYQFLNNIRTHSTTGAVQMAPEPYQFIAESDGLYGYNSAGAKIKLGEFKPNFGLVSDQIGVFLGGTLSSRPTSANEGDFYFSTDNATIYRYNGSKWAPFQTMDITQLEGFEDVITEKDVTTPVDTSTIYAVGQTIPRTNDNGLLPFNIAGNAAKIAGINAEVNAIQDGQVLTYRAATGSWRNEDKGVVGAGKALDIYDGDTSSEDDLKVVYAGDEEKTLNFGDFATQLSPAAPEETIVKLQSLLNAFAYQLDKIIGQTSWKDAPSASLGCFEVDGDDLVLLGSEEESDNANS